MKRHLTFLTLFICSLTATAFGQQAKISGYVSTDKGVRVAGVRIVVTPGGQAGTTDSKGQFTINLPDDIRPGQAAQIRVDRPGWVIFNPMFGKCEVKSAERNYEPLPVVIVPKGSPLALSPSRLSAVIAQWTAERAKLRTEVGHLKQELDEYAFLQQYAKEYGFTLDQFRAAAEQWAQIKDSDDKEERALKEYWHNNYSRAAQLAEESAQTADEELEQASKKTAEASLKVIRRYKLEGNAFYADYKFSEALVAYSQIEQRFEARTPGRKISKEDFTEEWAEVKLLIGNTKSELGTRVEGEAGPRFLAEALDDYRQAETFYTRGQSPQQWAATQTDLGDVLSDLGERVDGSQGFKYLNDSVDAYHAAMGVYTRDQFPNLWALIQTNLGVVLTDLSGWAEGSQELKYLNDAATAHRAALEVYTRNQSPQQWAMTQNNLGNVLRALGGRAEGSQGLKYLNDAVAAYRAALEVRTRAQSPQEWAMTQNNLGNVLSDLGKQSEGSAGLNYLKDAVVAYQAALEVYTRDQFPQLWAATQNNLAITYVSFKDWTGASEAFANVLQVNPDNMEAYSRMASLYHNSSFKFDQAFALHQQWLARHQGDISAQAHFAEAYFTTARFSECEQRIAALLARPEIPDSSKTALRAIEIASLLALGQPKQVPARLDALIEGVAHQSPTFKIEWSFDGTRYFIAHSEKLSARRVRLEHLLDALASKDRDIILKMLQEVRATFKE